MSLHIILQVYKCVTGPGGIFAVKIVKMEPQYTETQEVRLGMFSSKPISVIMYIFLAIWENHIKSCLWFVGIFRRFGFLGFTIMSENHQNWLETGPNRQNANKVQIV